MWNDCLLLICFIVVNYKFKCVIHIISANTVVDLVPSPSERPLEAPALHPMKLPPEIQPHCGFCVWIFKARHRADSPSGDPGLDPWRNSRKYKFWVWCLEFSIFNKVPRRFWCILRFENHWCDSEGNCLLFYSLWKTKNMKTIFFPLYEKLAWLHWLRGALSYRKKSLGQTTPRNVLSLNSPNVWRMEKELGSWRPWASGPLGRLRFSWDLSVIRVWQWFALTSDCR